MIAVNMCVMCAFQHSDLNDFATQAALHRISSQLNLKNEHATSNWLKKLQIWDSHDKNRQRLSTLYVHCTINIT